LTAEKEKAKVRAQLVQKAAEEKAKIVAEVKAEAELKAN